MHLPLYTHTTIARGVWRRSLPSPLPPLLLLLPPCPHPHSLSPLFPWQANKTGGFPALKFRSLLPKYSDMYTLVIEDMDSRKLASFEASVGKYFTKVSDVP